MRWTSATCAHAKALIPRAFVSQRYYDPREDGPVLAASRFDGKAVLQRGVELSGMMRDLVRMTDTGSSAPGQQPIEMPGQAAVLSSAYAAQATQFGRSDALAVGGINEVAVPVTAESRVYAGYAQHYLLTYFPNAYPRWYVDGFGELFATIVSREDGQIEYGRPPEGYAKALNQYMRYPIADVLTGKYLTDKRTTERWTPFHAWALTHMLFFSEERRGQLHAYLSTIAAGGSPEKAAAAFGDLGKLQRDLAAYDNHKVPYERMTYPADRAGEPIVRRLTEGQAAFVKGRLELGARVDIPPASNDPALAKARADAIRERDEWLAGLRKDAARYRANLEAQLLLAEAECRSGHGAECAEAADRALALAPQNSDALAWMGAGQMQLALAGPASDRAVRLKTARATIARANRIDTENPLPLLLYYRSFADAGENAPDVAIEGLAKAVDTVPAAPGPRVLLGEALAKRGETVAARRALLPVAMGAYDSPEKVQAQALLASLGG